MFSLKSSNSPNRHLIRNELEEAFLDFMLSKQAILCKPSTMEFYKFTTGKFVEWLDVSSPTEIEAKHVRGYLAELANRGLSDTTIHCHARAIRTFVRFLHSENYINEPINFTTPSLSKKKLHVLSSDEVMEVMKACRNNRDKTINMLMVDSGLRRGEVCALNWRNIDLASGVVRVENGKGGRARSVVIGAKTRRALLAYRRTVPHNEDSPTIQTNQSKRLSPLGLRSIFSRLSRRAGIHITPHVLRRTFATLSLRAGMNILHLQGLLGHSSLEMTRHYVQMLDDDLVEAHKAHGPVDNLLNY